MQRLETALAGRYRIERELGRGGMAAVFLAEDLKHHRRVAIKVMDPGIGAALGPERFLREVETAARRSRPRRPSRSSRRSLACSAASTRSGSSTGT